MKTGPVGVILDTMNNAFETAENIIQDYKEGEGQGSKLSEHVRDYLSNIGSLAAPEDPSSDVVSFLSSLKGKRRSG